VLFTASDAKTSEEVENGSKNEGLGLQLGRESAVEGCNGHARNDDQVDPTKQAVSLCCLIYSVCRTEGKRGGEGDSLPVQLGLHCIGVDHKALEALSFN